MSQTTSLRQAGKPPKGTGATAADVVRINVASTKYSVVSVAARELGIVPAEDDSSECNVYWIDTAIPLEKFLELKRFQRINHFPGMGAICRKDSLARNMQKMRRVHREEYHFAPCTWVLPGEYNALCCHIRELKRRRRHRTFIIKPHNGAMGNGISLVHSVDGIPKDQCVVVQNYIDKPFLLDGFKCDLRLYVLVTSCNPLRIFVYKDGLVRLSTQTYSPPTETNLDQCFMHLTNYSVNKHSDSFDDDESTGKGSKRTLKYFSGWLQQNGYDVIELWARIHDVIIKTVLLAHPHLVHSYQACRPGCLLTEKSQCFEILGFDILLDSNLNPWLLEVNRSPSFGTDSPLDLDIKTGVIKDALRLMDIRPSDKQRAISAEKSASRRRLLHSSSRPLRRAPYDFLAEQEEAAYEVEKTKQEVRERLLQIRKERKQEGHEEANMGDYVRVYPTRDPIKSKLYTLLLQSSSKISLLGRSGTGHRRGLVSTTVLKMKEQELLDLLCQYEEEEEREASHSGRQYEEEDGGAWHSGSSHSSAVQSLALQQDSTPLDVVIAARLAEEEQTQRTMIALNEMRPSYPGRSSTDLQRVLEEINSDIAVHTPNIASFWLVSLDNTKRKQLLSPLRESVKGILHCYWRTSNLESVRLYQIVNRLFNFLLSNSGQSLWSSFTPTPLSKSWETAFRKKSEVISTAEMVCCRRIVTLCQSSLIAGYYYHHLHRPKRPSSSVPKCPSLPSVPKCPSLPSVKRRPSLTSQWKSRHSLHPHTPQHLTATMQKQLYHKNTS